jgi:hypothetical protein
MPATVLFLQEFLSYRDKGEAAIAGATVFRHPSRE